MTHLKLSGLLGDRRWVLLPLAALSLASSATYVAQALAMAGIFGIFTSSGSADLTPRVIAPLLVLTAALAIRPVVLLTREMFAVRLMTATKLRLRDELADQLMVESARDRGQGRTGGDSALLVDGVENLDPYLSKYLPTALTSVIVCLAVAVLMTTMDPVIAGVTVLGAATFPLVPRLWDRLLARRGSEHWQAYQELHAEFIDSMQGMTTLVTLGADGRRHGELAAASRRLLQRTLRQLKISLIESGLNTFALSAVPMLSLALVWARRDHVSATEAFAFALLSVELVRPLRDLATQWHAGYLGTFSGEQIRTVLARRTPSGRATMAPSAVRAVELVDVSYRYRDSSAAALSRLSMSFEPGLTAIVGSSGSGKSTIAALLGGLDEPEHGSVTVDATVCPAPTRLGTVSLIPQDPSLFAGTVRDNIVAGRTGIASEWLDAVATIAGIGSDDPFLTFDTPVGEHGALLSGGQRQRIAIARGLVDHRPVLVLDEATSALDPRSERTLLTRVRDASRGRILIVVAHRLASIADADQVLVLEDGRIVERGRPDELATVRGRYAALTAISSSDPRSNDVAAR